MAFEKGVELTASTEIFDKTYYKALHHLAINATNAVPFLKHVRKMLNLQSLTIVLNEKQGNTLPLLEERKG